MKVGGIGLSAGALPGLANVSLAGESQAANSPLARAKSVVLLWMAGGVTHIDSFDPKPDAPEEINGTLSTISTRLGGVQFCETLPHLAVIADRLAVLRSYSHDSNDHFLSQAFALSGRKVPMSQIRTEPNVGSIVSHLHGPRNGLPGYIAVPGITRPGPPPHNLFVGGWLGEEYAPFAVGGEPAEPDFTATRDRWGSYPDEFAEDIRPAALEYLAGLDADRLNDRSLLRRKLETTLAAIERSRQSVVDAHYDSALHMLLAPSVRRAFEVQTEPDAVRAAYGRTKIGGRCLMARRLIEAGARFVMVDYGYDPDYGNLWDNHRVPIQQQPHICEIVKRPWHMMGVDKACAALISDLDARGLLDSTLVVFLTEFGRTPKINADGGRDHWGLAGSLFFAGGGVPAGQVIGQTDRQGAAPLGRGYSPADVAATIYKAIGIDPSQRLQDRQGRPVFVLPEGEPIPELA